MPPTPRTKCIPDQPVTPAGLTRHDGLLALMALGGVLIGVALCAEQLVIFGGEGLVHQGAFTLEALETVLVPVAILIGQVLWKGPEGVIRQCVCVCVCVSIYKGVSM